jgi:hypothetical protein
MDWQLADAKNRFSELVSKALSVGPQYVRRRHDAVVVMAQKDYLRLIGKRPGLKAYLLQGPDFADLDLTRDKSAMRDVSL